MSTKQDPDLRRAASHRHMINHLTGPFSAGAVDTAIPVDEAGVVEISWETREPLLLVAPLLPLGNRRLRVDATLDPGGAAKSLPSIVFDPYTETGAFLALYRPELGKDASTVPPFTVRLALVESAEDGSKTTVPQGKVRDRIDVNLVEGVMGRMIYLMGEEKQRLRRQGRELAAMRQLSLSRDDAMDRIGAGLGVARFTDRIMYDKKRREIITAVRKNTEGRTVPETDAEYRRRLAIYRPMLMPTRECILDLLNGPGEDSDENKGLLGELGLKDRFHVLETDNEFAVSIHLFASGDPQYRTNFIDYVRGVHLIWPQSNAAANNVHNSRFIPRSRRDHVNKLRESLRSNFGFPAKAVIAPFLAAALDRAGRCRRALGITDRWRIYRTQSINGGSRYELGLGVDASRIPAGQLNSMAQKLLDPNRPAVKDPEIENLLRSMEPRPPADDPEGRWLLEACGLRTLHPIITNGNKRLYISHLPTFGMVITGPSTANSGDQVPLEVRYHAPEDPGSNVVLVNAIEAAAEEWAAAGGKKWTVLNDAAARSLWDHADAPGPALAVFRAAGLPAVETPAPVVERLKRLPEELVETIRLANSQAQRILGGVPAAIDELRTLVELLRDEGLVSVLPFATDTGKVILVTGVIGLPEAGINLYERRATGFRWYVVPIQGDGGEIKAIGSRTFFIPNGPGLSALVAIGYARRGLTDPYEFRVELPRDATLNLEQYEFLMNILKHSYPLGVEVNTFSIRKRHVDLDGDGTPEPLPPTISKTFRQFRRRRHKGEIGVNIGNAGSEGT